MGVALHATGMIASGKKYHEVIAIGIAGDNESISKSGITCMAIGDKAF